jgi:hypothetical protein
VDKQHVNVTHGIAIASSGRTKYAREVGLGPPLSELSADSVEHRRPHAGKKVRYWSGEMVPIQFVNPISPHFGGLNYSLFDKPGEAAANSNFRASYNLLGDVSYRERSAGSGEDSEHGSV